MIKIFSNFVLYLIKLENDSKAWLDLYTGSINYVIVYTTIAHTTPTVLQFISKYNTSRRDLDIRLYTTYLRPLGLCERSSGSMLLRKGYTRSEDIHEI